MKTLPIKHSLKQGEQNERLIYDRLGGRHGLLFSTFKDDGVFMSNEAMKQAINYFPSFMRKRIEQAIDSALHPKGMSVHDGKATVYASDLQRMLLVVDLAAKQLAKPEQEHVAWVVRRTTSEGDVLDGVWTCDSDEDGAMPVYTAPPRKDWVSLTDDEQLAIASTQNKARIWFVWETEAKLKELNK